MAFPLNWFIQDQVWQLAVSMTTAMLFMSAGAAITPTVFAAPTHLPAPHTTRGTCVQTRRLGGTGPLNSINDRQGVPQDDRIKFARRQSGYLGGEA